MLDVEITAQPLMGIYLLSYHVDCRNNQNSINNTSSGKIVENSKLL